MICLLSQFDRNTKIAVNFKRPYKLAQQIEIHPFKPNLKLSTLPFYSEIIGAINIATIKVCR